jgi:hypothetical protein
MCVLLQVVFYDANGRQLQAFDYSTDGAARDFSCAAINPSNDTAVVGAYNRLYVFSLSNSTGVWQHMAVKQVSSGCIPMHLHAQLQPSPHQPQLSHVTVSALLW